jgi:hypothetical protein
MPWKHYIFCTIFQLSIIIEVTKLKYFLHTMNNRWELSNFRATNINTVNKSTNKNI